VSVADFDNTTMCRLDTQRKAIEPCSIVIFGASGDLTARKLIPALISSLKDNQLPPAFRIIGFARREKTDESFRAELREALGKFSRTKPVDDAAGPSSPSTSSIAWAI
jgi:glucose-6-phosphate 1-dehydrogenase